MKIDNIIKLCLAKGEIWVSSRGHELCAVLTNNGNELVREYSEKGIHHLLLIFTGEVLDNNNFRKLADKRYKHPLSPMNTLDLDHFFLDKRTTRIYLAGNFIQIDAHQAEMPTRNSLPGLYYKRGRGNFFDEALRQMLSAEPVRELSITDPI